MTVSSTENRKDYVGNGVTTSFSFPYPVQLAADLKVYQNSVLKTLTTHYTLSGTAPYTLGTNVQFVTAPAVDDEVAIVRDPALTQTTDLAEGILPVESIESALDRQAMISQAISARVSRALRLADSDPTDGDDMVLPAVASRASKYMFFDVDGLIEPAVALSGTILSQSIFNALLATSTLGTLVPPLVFPIEAGETGVLDTVYPRGHVLRYGTNTTPGTTDMTTAFQNASLSSLNPYAPAGTYKITASIPYRANQHWVLNGAIVQITGNVKVFTATTVNDWSLVWRGSCVGDNGAAGATSGTGAMLAIIDCARFFVLPPVSLNIKGWGILVQPGSSTTARSEHGQILAPQCYACYIGIEVQAGQGAEYVTVVAPNVSRCNTGMLVAAGNCNVLGGSATDNKDGISLANGTNHAHGAFIGTQINHNTQYGVRSDSVTTGHNFIGCHLYEDDIYLKQSQGILFKDCTVDYKNYYAEGSQGCGFINCALPGAYLVSTQENFNGNPSYTIWRNNQKLTGKGYGSGANINGLRVNATSGGIAITAATLNAETTLLLADTSNQSANNSAQTLFDGYNAATGIYTARGLSCDAKTRANVLLRITNNVADDASGAMNSMYAYLRKNGSGVYQWLTRVRVNTTHSVYIGNVNLELNDTDTMEIRLGSSVLLANGITVSATDTNVIVEGL